MMAHIDTTSSFGIRNRAIVELLYSSGVRVSELTGLKIEDIDFKNEYMKVFGKGSKERLVPIGKTALNYLKNYISGVRPFFNGASKYREVFLGYHGTPLQCGGVENMLKELSEKAKMPARVTPHILRRSCTTELIRGNANLYHVKEILGHKKLDTLKHYVKLNITDLKKTHRNCHPREKKNL
jgi:integrase/recombinase XerD